MRGCAVTTAEAYRLIRASHGPRADIIAHALAGPLYLSASSIRSIDEVCARLQDAARVFRAARLKPGTRVRHREEVEAAGLEAAPVGRVQPLNVVRVLWPDGEETLHDPEELVEVVAEPSADPDKVSP